MLGAEKLPTGFRFCPTDDILFWLLDLKLRGTPDPYDPIPDQIDVYGSHPQNLQRPENLGGETVENYYYVQRRRQSNNASRPGRVIADGSGYWKSSQKKHPIKNEEGVIMGDKMGLVFCLKGKDEKGNNLETKTHWLMNEYTLPIPNGSNFTQLVISSIKYTGHVQHEAQVRSIEEEQSDDDLEFAAELDSALYPF
ncbi:hypothetical protein GIB67_022546 [Kingdonia uniflora]|uniref:NAC domain-containing protein n=1 Tax=Kingdonia uniflora TaxID=39325 RepID=A0A7J7L7F6_9MAGN|nr:hypothetical protein GIB67_022546 [Kingdonia uniflora]